MISLFESQITHIHLSLCTYLSLLNLVTQFFSFLVLDFENQHEQSNQKQSKTTYDNTY